MLNNISDYIRERAVGHHDITGYIRNMDIKEARRLGVIVTSIDCRWLSTDEKLALERSIYKWAKEDVMLNNETSSNSYSYGGAGSNGRKLRGREREDTKIFSNFTIDSTSDDGYPQDLKFRLITQQETEEFKDHENYDTQKAPTMLQIAFALVKRYEYKGENLDIEVTGYIPGINELWEGARKAYGIA